MQEATLILKVKVIEKEDGTEQIVFYFPEEGEPQIEGKVIAEKEVGLEGNTLIEIGEGIEVHRVEKLRIDPEIVEEIEGRNSEPPGQNEVN